VDGTGRSGAGACRPLVAVLHGWVADRASSKRSAEISDRLVQRQQVFYGDVGLHVVYGIEHVAAAAAENLDSVTVQPNEVISTQPQSAKALMTICKH